MNEKSHGPSQMSPIGDATHDTALAGERAAFDSQKDEPFYYASGCLGFFPVGPLDFQDFAQGQLMALAIFVPAAISLFLFCAM